MLHDGTHRQSSSETLNKYCSPLCTDGESCAFANLTMQELFAPLLINELAACQFPAVTHWND